MPSLPHASLVEIVCDRPRSWWTSFGGRTAWCSRTPPTSSRGPTATGELDPAELRADLVLRLGDPDGALVVEIQLAVDEANIARCTYAASAIVSRVP